MSGLVRSGRAASLRLKAIGTDCRTSFGPKLEVKRTTDEALVHDWFVQAPWHTYFKYRGLRKCTPSDARDSIRTRNWNGTSYHEQFPGVADGRHKPDSWNVKLSATHGTNQESLHIAPDFHMMPEDSGLWHETYSFANIIDTVTVPLADNGIRASTSSFSWATEV